MLDAKRRILIVEDLMPVAIDLEAAVDELGCQVVGPVGRLDQALALARNEAIDVALLDINIEGEMSFPIADVLSARGIPFLFVTGYSDGEGLPERYLHHPRIVKPYNFDTLKRELLHLLKKTGSDAAFEMAAPQGSIGGLVAHQARPVPACRKD